MGINSFLKDVFGRGQKSESESEPEIETPDIVKMLPITPAMAQTWKDEARKEAEEVSDMPRTDIIRNNHGIVLPDDLPGAGEERRAAVALALEERSIKLYRKHVEEIQDLYPRSDKEILDRFHEVADPSTELPGLDKPRERADFISMRILDDNSYDQMQEERYREEFERARFPDNADWHEFKAGEPAILVAERDGDYAEVSMHREAFFDRFQVKDPTIKEIAPVAAYVSDEWEHATVESLASGTVRLSPSAAERLLASPEVQNEGPKRDQAIVEAYLDDFAKRNPEVEKSWVGRAKEIMAEPAPFMQNRYGVEDAYSMTTRDVVVKETLYEMSRSRLEQSDEAALDIVAGKDRPQAIEKSVGDEPVQPSHSFNAAAADVIRRSGIGF